MNEIRQTKGTREKAGCAACSLVHACMGPKAAEMESAAFVQLTKQVSLTVPNNTYLNVS
ncbi:hypothetical protein PAECIP111890_03031 [Paenibacillus sp. JJ-223]|nr:hypothetical protein PAECIP111890_03031 [Paenibacillus sp. JJ-223]